jgi:hypothetical protein
MVFSGESLAGDEKFVSEIKFLELSFWATVGNHELVIGESIFPPAYHALDGWLMLMRQYHVESAHGDSQE